MLTGMLTADVVYQREEQRQRLRHDDDGYADSDVHLSAERKFLLVLALESMRGQCYDNGANTPVN